MKFRFHIFLILCIFLCAVCGFSNQTKWRKIISGSIVLYCHDEDIQYGQKIILIIDENLPRIMEDLGLSELDGIQVIIASSDNEFTTLTGGQIPEWGVAAADPEQFAIFFKSPYLSSPEANFNQVVVHELSHVVIGQALEGRQVDRWLDEGFAQYEAGEHGIQGTILLARSLLTNNIIWLHDVDDVLAFRREKAALAYQVSYRAVQYLVDTYGEDVVKRIVQVLKSDKEMDEALFATIGIGFQDFQDNWYHTMKRKYLWYLFLDFPFLFSILLLLLFFTALFVTRKRIVKKRRMWELEESYDY